MPRKATKKATKRHAKSAQVQLKKARPNVEKMCSFWELPTLLRAPILKKLDAVSLTRMRRANKAINHLIEETGLRTRSDQQLVIRVEIVKTESPISYLTTRDEFFDCRRSFFHALDYEMVDYNCTNINDPLKELGGFHFKSVLLDFCSGDIADAPEFWSCFMKMAMPTLEVLKPQCDTLIFTWMRDCRDVLPVLEHVTFTSLVFEDCEIDATKMNFKVTNGNIINILNLEPNDVVASFGTLCQFKDARACIWEEGTNVIPEVVKAVHELPLGKLEKLRLWVHSERHYCEGESLDDDDDEDDDEEEEEEDEDEVAPVQKEHGEKGDDDGEEEDEDDHWEADPLDDDDLCDPHNISLFAYISTIRAKTSKGRVARSKFYKMPINGEGQAIIVKAISIAGPEIATDFAFYVFRNYSKKNLFEAFFNEYFELWDLADGLRSPLFREFMETSSEQEAMTKACKDKEKLRAWLQENAKAPAVFKGRE